MYASSKTQRLTSLALLGAIVVVLQVVATFIKFGPFVITLTLVPIVVGAAIYGPKAGAFLGGVFGLVVFVACVAGWDPGGNILFTAQPFTTAVLCLAKGSLAGLAAGGVFALCNKKDTAGSRTLGTVLAAITGPVVNSGIFCLAMVLLYQETLVAWAGGTSVVYYILTGLVGVNFLLELGLNVIISPTIVQIIKIKKHIQK